MPTFSRIFLTKKYISLLEVLITIAQYSSSIISLIIKFIISIHLFNTSQFINILPKNGDLGNFTYNAIKTTHTKSDATEQLMIILKGCILCIGDYYRTPKQRTSIRNTVYFNARVNILVLASHYRSLSRILQIFDQQYRDIKTVLIGIDMNSTLSACYFFPTIDWFRIPQTLFARCKLYGVHTSQLIQYSRTCGFCQNFLD